MTREKAFNVTVFIISLQQTKVCNYSFENSQKKLYAIKFQVLSWTVLNFFFPATPLL